MKSICGQFSRSERMRVSMSLIVTISIIIQLTISFLARAKGMLVIASIAHFHSRAYRRRSMNGSQVGRWRAIDD